MRFIITAQASAGKKATEQQSDFDAELFKFGADDVLETRQLTGSGDLPPEILQLIAEAAPTWSASAWGAPRA